jgi:ubiquinone/menaquinone biosynthesis C-methylase UbiE
MDEQAIEAFWQAHPCGESLAATTYDDYELFFTQYDAVRYAMEKHILRCLDEIEFDGQRVLEIGLGQGADSEQIIRRGGRWSGLELTQKSVDRVRTRLALRELPYDEIRLGSALRIPWPDQRFDLVYSHGVMHHVPAIHQAQAEIARVLKPGGRLVLMLYAKRSLNYLISIAVIRRLALVVLHTTGAEFGGVVGKHLELAHRNGLWRYLQMKNFLHRNTDGPSNPYSKVYTRNDVVNDFPAFVLDRIHQEFMHAPPLPVHGWPGASLLGWHLWAHLTRR